MICLLCQQEYQERERFLDLVLLRQEKGIICEDCQSQFERIGDRHCPSCYKSGSEEICEDCCNWAEAGYKVKHQALFSYNDGMKDYFSRFKFEGDYILSRIFANQMKAALKAYKGYKLVPVPVSQERYQERQFNQVTALLDAAGICYDNLLLKAHTDKQSSKSKAERLQLKNPFKLNQPVAEDDKILVIDDIYTTGATLAAAVAIFKENRVQTVKTFSLAR